MTKPKRIKVVYWAVVTDKTKSFIGSLYSSYESAKKALELRQPWTFTKLYIIEVEIRPLSKRKGKRK